MTKIQKLYARTIISRIAKQQGISTAECRAAIQEVISTAWATSDPEVKDRQIRLVGDSTMPSPEEIIILISKEIT